METIKKYFSVWDFSRIFKLLLGVGLLAGYFSTKESIYLIGSIFFSGQALLNIGCPGNTCSTDVRQESAKKVIEFEQYEPDKNKENV